MNDSTEEQRHLLGQLVARVGTKRALDVLCQAEPAKYDAMQKCTLLTVIESDTILALILNPLWCNVRSLAKVCKRFAAATRRPEFWMRGVRETLRWRYPAMHANLLCYVDPFFRFPIHVPCPSWE